ncbi:hypothetical protein QFZ42_001880 [Variovorax paradoxus]|uniref:hypothetical protein n=1 Tax=Variovorax paradoxus TaxID=34073 RepID=UPI002794E571|nr:hypothetical protein [Variovorax paradoxus]MDQ0570046.1 hypothetical protein [Variovorax paradoxus]
MASANVPFMMDAWPGNEQNQAWLSPAVADFTYIRIETGFCYLAAVIAWRIVNSNGFKCGYD